MSLSEFLHMGGYAFHVWSAYGLSFVLMLWLVIAPMRQRKKQIKRIHKIIRRSEDK